MSSPTTSLVAVGKADALRAVKAMRDAIPGIIAKAREATIVEAMAEERKWMFGLLGRNLTRAEAEHIVDTVTVGDMGFPHRYSYWRSRASGIETFANHLDTAARLTQDDNLWLNLEDAHSLSTWLT